VPIVNDLEPWHRKSQEEQIAEVSANWQRRRETAPRRSVWPCTNRVPIGEDAVALYTSF